MTEPNILLILQSCSLTVSALLALILLASRIHHPQTSANYETSRWLMFTSMLIYVVHYFLQIRFGFRARSEELGALVNILFYSPVSYLLSYASLRMVSNRHHKRVYMCVSIVGMALVFGCFVGGYIVFGTPTNPITLKAMGTVFFISILWLTIYPSKEIRRVTRQVENETGGDIRQFNLYMRTGTILLYAIAVLLPFCIYSIKSLAVLGPIFLIALVLYVLSFVSLGFNLSQVSDIIDEESEVDDDESASEPVADKEESTQAVNELTEERKEAIRKAIEHWRTEGGYSQSDVNSTNLAAKLHISKRHLILYLSECEGKTFRVWLSELRIEEAKRMLLEAEDYKLETIAYACGFSHRNYLQNRFKSITGFTPREWQDVHKKS